MLSKAGTFAVKSSVRLIEKHIAKAQYVLLLFCIPGLLTVPAAAQTTESKISKPTLGQYAIYVRTFIPFAELGKVPGFPPYRGDNRGVDTSSSVTSRVTMRVVVDFLKNEISQWNVWSDPSHRGELSAVSKPTATLVHHFGDAGQVTLQFSLTGRDPIPLSVNVGGTELPLHPKALIPTADILGLLSLKWKQGSLEIETSVWGDLFPDAEIFAEDWSGERVFIATHTVEDLVMGDMATVYTLLAPDPLAAAPDGRFLLAKSQVVFSLGPFGNFKTVRYGRSFDVAGKPVAQADYIPVGDVVELSIHEWNRQFRLEYALGRLVGAIPGAKPNLDWAIRAREVEDDYRAAEAERRTLLENVSNGGGTSAAFKTALDRAARERAELLLEYLKREQNISRERERVRAKQMEIRALQERTLKSLADSLLPARSQQQEKERQKSEKRFEQDGAELTRTVRNSVDRTSAEINAHRLFIESNQRRLLESQRAVEAAARSAAQNASTASLQRTLEHQRQFTNRFRAGSPFGVTSRSHRPPAYRPTPYRRPSSNSGRPAGAANNPPRNATLTHGPATIVYVPFKPPRKGPPP